MVDPQQSWTDQRIDEYIGNLLRAGVLLAASVVFAGGVWYLAQHAFDAPDYHQFDPDRVPNLRTFSGLSQGLVALRGRAFVQLGLLILVATPIARVAFSIVAFALEHDRTYVLITLLVLCVLLYSLIWGKF
jgi:uncharacterized membrane protein